MTIRVYFMALIIGASASSIFGLKISYTHDILNGKDSIPWSVEYALAETQEMAEGYATSNLFLSAYSTIPSHVLKNIFFMPRRFFTNENSGKLSTAVPIDPYKILRVDENAGNAKIRRQYYQLARDTHPDKHSGDIEKEKLFKDISQAYEKIGTEEKREAFEKEKKAANALKELPQKRTSFCTKVVSIPIIFALLKPILRHILKKEYNIIDHKTVDIESSNTTNKNIQKDQTLFVCFFDDIGNSLYSQQIESDGEYIFNISDNNTYSLTKTN